MTTRKISWFAVLLTYLLIFGEASISKFAGGATPTWFLEQFKDSLLDWGPPSLQIAFWSIAMAETTVVGLLIGSLIKNEFSKDRSPFFSAALTLSQLIFIGLMLGMRLTHKYGEAQQLFFYAFSTFIFLHLHLRNQKDIATCQDN